MLSSRWIVGYRHKFDSYIPYEGLAQLVERFLRRKTYSIAKRGTTFKGKMDRVAP